MALTKKAALTLVKSLPIDMPTAEVVEIAKQRGIRGVTKKYIGSTRYRMRQEAGDGPVRDSPTKKDVILSYPFDMDANDVVSAAAAEHGVELKVQTVHQVRSVAKRGGRPKRVPQKQALPSAAAPRVNKQEFVASLPDDMSVDEIMRIAAERGIELSKQHVWVSRSIVRRERREGKRPPAPASAGSRAVVVSRPTRQAVAPAGRLPTSERQLPLDFGAEQALVEAIQELGLERAVQIFHSTCQKRATEFASLANLLARHLEQ